MWIESIRVWVDARASVCESLSVSVSVSLKCPLFNLIDLFTLLNETRAKGINSIPPPPFPNRLPRVSFPARFCLLRFLLPQIKFDLIKEKLFLSNLPTSQSILLIVKELYSQVNKHGGLGRAGFEPGFIRHAVLRPGCVSLSVRSSRGFMIRLDVVFISPGHLPFPTLITIPIRSMG